MRILCYILVVLFVTTSAVGQQINPVPDYIFRNSMSVGRNAPTDTSAYFSIGPRFGATRGFMPPMVVDTAAVTGTKRNGLLIYSIQRNSFLYWDSTGSRWSRIAANLDTLLLSTRAWRQKGIDSLASVRIGGSGVTGYIPKFTEARTLDSSQIFQNDGRIGIGTSNPVGILDILQNTSGDAILRVYNTNTSGTGKSIMRFAQNRTTVPFGNQMQFTDSLAFTGTIASDRTNGMTFFTGATSGSTDNERMRINASGNLAIGTTADNGYRVNVSGTMRTTDATWLGTSTRTVGIGTTTFTAGGATSFAQLVTSGPSGGLIINSDSGNISRIFFTRKNSIADNEGLIRYNTGSFNMDFWTAAIPRMTIFGNGRIGVNTTTDAGYQFDVAGSMRNTTDAYFNTSSGETYIGTTSDAGAFRLQVNGVAYAVDGFRTGNPTGGTAATWKLGTVATVSPTSPNRTIEVDIGGTIYYIHAKTTND